MAHHACEGGEGGPRANMTRVLGASYLALPDAGVVELHLVMELVPGGDLCSFINHPTVRMHALPSISIVCIPSCIMRRRKAGSDAECGRSGCGHLLDECTVQQAAAEHKCKMGDGPQAKAGLHLRPVGDQVLLLDEFLWRWHLWATAR